MTRRALCDALPHQNANTLRPDAAASRSQEVLEGSTFEGASAIPSTQTVFLPPREYAKFAIAKLPVVHATLDIPSRTVPSPTSKRAPGIGSHRFHASMLVCHLIRAAHASPQGGPLIAPLVASNLLPRVAHLALTHPNCSCMHATLLSAMEDGVLAAMPPALWASLLQDNLGLSQAEAGGAKRLPALPDLIMQHGARRAVLGASLLGATVCHAI